MILDINGKRFAFGMSWGVIADTKVEKEAQARAIAAKSPMLWLSEKGHLVGLLADADRFTKIKEPVYSGAITLSLAFGDNPNVFIAFKIKEDQFLVVGIENGKPRKDFDSIKTSQQAVEMAKRDFVQICSGAEVHIAGNTQFLGGHEIALEIISDYVTKACQLKKTKAVMPKTYKTLGIFSAILLIGFVGWQQYKAYEEAEIKRKALEAQQKIQEKYDQALKLRRAQIVLSHVELPSFLEWVKAWPTDVGGWYLDRMNCSSTLPIRCTVSFEKSGFRLATFQSFYAAAGKRFESVSLDKTGARIEATVTIDSLKGRTIGEAIDAAKSSDDAINEAGSMLQIIGAGKMPFVNDTGTAQLDFSDYALPPGVTRNKLKKPPVRYTTWQVDIPARDLPLLTNLPPYISIDSVLIKIARKPSTGVQNSFVTAVVKGSVFAKPL